MKEQKNPKEQKQDKRSIDVLPQVYASNDCLMWSDFVDYQRGKRALAGKSDPDRLPPSKIIINYSPTSHLRSLLELF
jgi:hypothetical protein